MTQPTPEETELRERLREKYCGDMVLDRGLFAVTVRFRSYGYGIPMANHEIHYSEPDPDLRELLRIVMDRLFPVTVGMPFQTAWIVWHPLNDKMFLEYRDGKRQETVKLTL